jgi:hypothetical protein
MVSARLPDRRRRQLSCRCTGTVKQAVLGYWQGEGDRSDSGASVVSFEMHGDLRHKVREHPTVCILRNLTVLDSKFFPIGHLMKKNAS